MAIIVINLDTLGVVVLIIELVHERYKAAKMWEVGEAYVVDNPNIDITSLLGWVRWRLVGEESITETVDISSLGFVGDLLTGPFPLEGCLDFVVLAIGG